MTWHTILKEDVTYYHATSSDNLMSIFRDGIKPGIDGIYSSDTAQLSINWICMTKPQTKKVMVVPYKADPRTHRPGTDHSPFMLHILGEPNAKVFVTSETILPDQIDLEGIRVVDNPCYNKDFEEKFKRISRREEE